MGRHDGTASLARFGLDFGSLRPFPLLSFPLGVWLCKQVQFVPRLLLILPLYILQLVPAMFDIHHVIRQPVLLATFALAVPAWIIAFIAQAISEARYNYGEAFPKARS